MYQIKRLLKRHIEENFLKYFLVLLLFAAGVMLGFIFSKNLKSGLAEELKGEVGNIIESLSRGKLNNFEIIKNSFFKSLRTTFFIFIGGFSVWLIPVSFFALLSYGFSVGFTVGYLSLNFGGTGLGIGISSVIFGLIINIPIYIILTVISMNNSLSNRRNKGEGGIGTYAVIFIVFFSISSITIVLDAFVVPGIIGLICS